MLDNYKMAFPDYNESYDILVGKGKINEFLAYLQFSHIYMYIV